MKIAAIAAVDRNGGIGRQGKLLCHMPADMQHFKAITMGYPIIMGRKTFESFPKGPLPGRLNIILTRNKNYNPPHGAAVCHNVNDAIELAAKENKELCFVIGGGQIYADFVNLYDELFLTRIEAQFIDADTFFPSIDMESWKIASHEQYPADERNPHPYSFIHLKRKK